MILNTIFKTICRSFKDIWPIQQLSGVSIIIAVLEKDNMMVRVSTNSPRVLEVR